MKKRILAGAVPLLMGVLFLPTLATAQERGTLTGVVSDAISGEPIPGVTVLVIGQKGKGAATDVNGKYVVQGLVPGTYDISLSYLTYESDTIRGVVVKAGKEMRLDATLSESQEEVISDQVVLTRTRSKKSEAGALNQRQNALQVSEVMSAEGIATSGASDAGDAMKRQTGVTVQNGKYLNIRGIGERYNTTQLNGVNLPSPEPEKKVVPFDLFPAGMIDYITIVKTFTPDNPGDFAGGLVKIETKDFPKHFIFNLGVGTGLNPETQGADALDYAGGGTDWLGIDDGTRALPDDIEITNRFDPQEQADLLRRFDNKIWTPSDASLPINQSFNVTLGNSFGDKAPIGFLFSGSYSNNFNYREGIERYPLLSLNNEGNHDLRYDYLTRESEQSVLWGTLLNLSLGLGDNNLIGFKGMLNHSAEDETSLIEGDFSSSTSGELRRTQLRFVERTIAGAQLLGKHTTDILSDGSQLEWRVAFSQASRSEPDFRAATYLRESPDEPYRYDQNFASGNGRFFSDLTDLEMNSGFDWTIPLYSGDNLESNTRLKIGSVVRLRDREFKARRFYFQPGINNPDVLALNPEELYTPEVVAQGIVQFVETTLANDQYNADERILAGYAMIEAPISDNLRFIGGARLEWWDVFLVPFDQNTGFEGSNIAVDKSEVDILPSVNLIYSLAEDMNLRGAFSQTLARPEFRELAPFRFDDYRQSTFGNPSLDRTRILNYDLRWEWFPRPGELVAVSAFYKNFTSPIEQFYLLGASDIQVEPVNANGANAVGAEIELRKSLDQIADALSDFSIGANITLVESNVTFKKDESVSIFQGIGITQAPSEILTNTERPLGGQSPYVVNLVLGYNNSGLGTDGTLLFNVFGKRLTDVGTNGYPDIYERPRPSLDFTLRQRLPAGLKLSLKAKNLLDSETRFTQEFVGKNAETIENERYFAGRSLSIGLSFSFDQLRIQQATK
ncbi:MAG: TonB-dependent receptor [Chlorobi bacterium]|nr:TonB-dependent receptor [Chlorobiota bacterium]